MDFMSSFDPTNIPIIIIPGMVFFPNTSIPILIEEPTYVKMVKSTIEEGGFIGVCMAEPSYESENTIKYSPLRTGSMGRPILVDEQEDGSIKILLRGYARIRLENITQNIPYLKYNIHVIPDVFEKNSLTLKDGRIRRLKGILDNWVNSTIDDSLERQAFSNGLSSLAHIMDYLSSFVVKDSQTKQLLLEKTSLFDRVQILDSILKGDFPEKEDETIANAILKFESLENSYQMVH